jgi:hypothetical protein
MGVLVGDVNGNGAVNATDVALTKSQVGMAVSSGNFREDVNANGTISSTDVAIVKSDVGTSLPFLSLLERCGEVRTLERWRLGVLVESGPRN